MVDEQYKIGHWLKAYSVVFRFDPFVNAYKRLLNRVLIGIFILYIGVFLILIDFFMQLEKKTCLNCSKNIHGRADKKFCDDYCRNNHNNQLKAYSNNLIRNVNNALKRNRSILEALLPDAEETAKTTRQDMLMKGFQFKYQTHTYTNKRGNVYFFCYDYGYLELEGELLLLVRVKEK